jgi:hypothetical protein
MQEIFYRDAPYHVLYYDSELHAYRTDRFGGWVNQPPENGTPLFGYGPIGYTKLTPAVVASPEPSAASPGAGASAAPSPPPGSGSGTGVSDMTPILLGLVAVVAIVAVGLVLARRGRGAAAEEE